jgi:hypothetical protein
MSEESEYEMRERIRREVSAMTPDEVRETLEAVIALRGAKAARRWRVEVIVWEVRGADEAEEQDIAFEEAVGPDFRRFSSAREFAQALVKNALALRLQGGADA